MYDPINNQRFCTLWLRGTGWRHKRFQGTGWRHKQFQGTGWRHKRFRGTGWRHKWFRGTCWRRKRSKKRSKQQSKGSYLHYQGKISTKIIEETVRPKDHPRRNLSNWPDGHGRCDNTSVATIRLTPPIHIFNSTSDFPTRTGTQDIFNPIGPAGPQWISKAQKLKMSINGLFDKNSVPRPSFSKVVVSKVTGDPRVDVNSRGGMHFGSDSVVTRNPNFGSFGVASVNTTDELGLFSASTTRVRRLTSSSDWSE